MLGDIPRSRYIRRTIERYLGSSKDILTTKQAAATKNRRSGIESNIMPFVSTGWTPVDLLQHSHLVIKQSLFQVLVTLFISVLISRI